jgi:hypothetical protein
MSPSILERIDADLVEPQRLGVWAAEGFQNEHRESGLSESRRSD